MSEVLSPAALDTVTTMAFGRKVLMIGTNFGQDMLSLAGSAQVLCAFTLPREGDFAEAVGKTAHLREQLHTRRLGSHVLLYSVPWDQGLSVHLVDDFDLAVINPGALGEDDPGELIRHVVQFADTLIVIEPSGNTWWEQVTLAVNGMGMLCSGDGQIIVARPVPTQPVVRQD